MISKRTLLALLLVGAAAVPLTSQAGLNISIGDQGYYTHGGSYNSGGYRYVWIPGHWTSRHRWVHGYYARRDRVHVGVGVGLGTGGVYIHP